MSKSWKQWLLHYSYYGLRLWWFVSRPTTQGVKCLIEHDGTFLFVRHSYGSPEWTIPGGGIQRNESSESAAKREALEELGIRLNEVKFIGKYSQIFEYKNDTVQCYYSRVTDPAFTIDNFEITKARWFQVDALPSPLAKSTQEIITLYESKQYT